MYAKTRNSRTSPPGMHSGPSFPEVAPNKRIDEIKALSIADVCRLYGIGRTFVYGQIRIGALVAQKAGRRTLIATDELERWFAGLPTANKSESGGRHG